MKYLVVDGMLHGTGIRDKNEGGYIPLESLKLPVDLIRKIEEWLEKYEQEHYNNFSNSNNIQELDKTGLEISKQLKLIFGGGVTYFSSATMQTMEV